MELTLNEIERTASRIPGDVVVYLLDGGLKRLYASEGIPALTGLTPEEFEIMRDEDAFGTVAESDRDRVLAEIVRGQKSGCDFDVTYRVINRDQGFIWVHGQGRAIGEMNGKPVVVASLVNASVETAPQDAVLANSDRPIYVIDRATFEILYMNAACEDLYGRKPRLGQTCHDYKYDTDEPCAWCPVPTMQGTRASLDEFYSEALGKWFQDDYHIIDWFGRKAVAVYAFDVTRRRNEQAELQETLDREERLIDYIRIVNAPDSLDARLNKVLCKIGSHLQADRAYIFDINGAKMSNTHEWCREGIAPQIDTLKNIATTIIDRWLPNLDNGRCVVVKDIESIKDALNEYELMSMQGISSYVIAPLMNEGKPIGYVGVDNPDSEKVEGCADLLLSIAYYLSGAIVRARDEQSLKDSQNRFQIAIDGAELGVWEYDIKAHTISSPSDSFAKFGITGTIENVPESILPMFDSSEKEKLLDFYRQLETGESKITGDFWVQWQPNASRRCERVFYTVEKDEEGNPSIAYGIGMNYTAQKLEQENFERSLKQVFTIGADTLSTYQLNLTKDTYEVLFAKEGYAEDTVEGDRIDDLMSATADRIVIPKERDRFLASLSRERLMERLESGESSTSDTYRRQLPDGKVSWVTVKSSIMKNPQTQEVIVAVSVTDGDDETVQNKVLEYISVSEYDHISIIYPYDETVRFYYFNSEELTEPAIDQKRTTLDYVLACKQAAGSWICPDESERFLKCCALDTIKTHLAQGDVYSYEIDAIRKDGQRQRKMLTYAYLDDTKERILEVQRDITEIYEAQKRRQAELAEQVRLEQELRGEAERANKMKSEFLSNVSHDMRTPLNAVLGYTGIAQASRNVDEIQSYLAKIGQSGQVLDQLINDTLDLNKISTGKVVLHPKPIAARDVLDDLETAMQPALQAKGVTLVSDFRESPMDVIDVDVVRIREILLNLLNNAVKFTPEGGTITLAIKRLSTEGDIAHDAFVISDTGCGMTPEFLQRAFEPFTQERTRETADIEGSGLGLAIVKGLVDQMGGWIEVESEVGKGSTFTVHLGLKLASEAAPRPVPKTTRMGEFAGCKGLLVEDNAMNTEIARTLLERLGMEVACATNGRDGVDAFRDSEPGEYDAIFMDVRMPIMDGLDAARAIRKLDRDDAKSIPIIAMTANAFEDDVAECLHAGMNAHVPKPIDPQVLSDTVKQVLG